jgi:membrane protein involved in colicin uptake
VADQQQLIASMQKEQQLASERSLEEQEELLRQEQQRRQQAQEEIERLKALLAQKEAEEAATLQRQEDEALARAEVATAAPAATAEAAAPSPAPATAPATAAAPAAPAPAAEPATAMSAAAPTIELITDRAQAAQLVARATAAAGKGNKLNKILHFKSYTGDELVERSSHSLQNLDNILYRGELELRRGKSEFVVGGDSWWLDIPAAAEGPSHIVLLDLADEDQPRLLLFAGNLAP